VPCDLGDAVEYLGFAFTQFALPVTCGAALDIDFAPADNLHAPEAVLPLIARHPGVVLIDVPDANAAAAPLLRELGFQPLSRTQRMYRGPRPVVPLEDVFGLACLELG
jgi:hypothetical protein